jgi:superfamily II DNA/RNA helicase
VPSVKTPDILSALHGRRMTHMFPIQAACYPPVAAGKDLIGRARTGTGKTLAFALPIIERLQAADEKKYGGTTYKLPARRHPRVLVLLPTRELALQVCGEFEAVGKRLSSTCIYGGAPMGQQGTCEHDV